jgi:FixJ family two-component response regulator
MPQVPPHPVVSIVDDDTGICSALSLLIASVGWKAQSFGSAEAFLDAYTPGSSHCLILDLHLPGMNGAQLLTELAARDIHIPTVIITARPDSPLATQAQEAGALTVLTKPFKSTELLPIVEQAARRAQVAGHHPA